MEHFAASSSTNRESTTFFHPISDTSSCTPCLQLSHSSRIDFRTLKSRMAHELYEYQVRDALVSILTNVAYTGNYLYNGVVVSREAHEPIVPMDDFLYAYARVGHDSRQATLDSQRRSCLYNDK